MLALDEILSLLEMQLILFGLQPFVRCIYMRVRTGASLQRLVPAERVPWIMSNTTDWRGALFLSLQTVRVIRTSHMLDRCTCV